MPRDTEIVKQIRLAEQTARDIRTNAEKDAKESFENALKEAKLYADEQIAECRRKNKVLLENAKKAAGEQIDCARITAYENAGSATKIPDSRTEKAVNAVISAVLEG